MARLIDAEYLETFLKIAKVAGSEINADTMLSVVETTPTVDAVEVVQGEWITKCMEGSWTHYRYSCSNCGSGFDSNSNYCPNCGAKMDDKNIYNI